MRLQLIRPAHCAHIYCALCPWAGQCRFREIIASMVSYHGGCGHCVLGQGCSRCTTAAWSRWWCLPSPSTMGRWNGMTSNGGEPPFRGLSIQKSRWSESQRLYIVGTKGVLAADLAWGCRSAGNSGCLTYVCVRTALTTRWRLRSTPTPQR